MRTSQAKAGMVPNPLMLMDQFDFLVVEDHEFMRRIIGEVLQASGAGRILSANDGLEALDVMKKARTIDCVITDFNMPGMNGLQLLKAIRTGETSVPPNTPVIMVSGFDDEALLLTAFNLDVQGFIPKPISRRDAVTRLNNTLMREHPLQDIEKYRRVTIPEIVSGAKDPIEAVKPASPGAAVNAGARAAATTIALEKVPPGALITEDIVTESGLKLVEAGCKASRQLIDFLEQTKQITKISQLTVYVGRENS